MGYVTAAIWLLAGLYLFRRSGENRVLLILSLYFFFVGVWWGARTATGIELFAGEWGSAFRCVTAVALLTAGLVFFGHETGFGNSVKQEKQNPPPMHTMKTRGQIYFHRFK